MSVKVSSALVDADLDKGGEMPVSAEELMRRRQEMFRRADQMEAPQLVLPSEEPTAPVEDLEAIEVQLPDGRVILFGPPPGVSLTMRNAIMFGSEMPNRLLSSLMRMLHCVRRVDGKAVAPITNIVDGQALANFLGDDVCDLLFDAMMTHWPPANKASLAIIKKFPRHQTSAS